jgi:hypothetical protein
MEFRVLSQSSDDIISLLSVGRSQPIVPVRGLFSWAVCESGLVVRADLAPASSNDARDFLNRYWSGSWISQGAQEQDWSGVRDRAVHWHLDASDEQHPNVLVAAFSEYAAADTWVTSQLMQLLGVTLMTAVLLLLLWSLSDGSAA